MKVMQPVLLSLFIGLVTAAAHAYSGADAHALPDNGGCHLMTESECKAHLGKLQGLQDPQERAAYLSRHKSLIDERRMLCGSEISRSKPSRVSYR